MTHLDVDDFTRHGRLELNVSDVRVLDSLPAVQVCFMYRMHPWNRQTASIMSQRVIPVSCFVTSVRLRLYDVCASMNGERRASALHMRVLCTLNMQRQSLKMFVNPRSACLMIMVGRRSVGAYGRATTGGLQRWQNSRLCIIHHPPRRPGTIWALTYFTLLA